MLLLVQHVRGNLPSHLVRARCALQLQRQHCLLDGVHGACDVQARRCHLHQQPVSAWLAAGLPGYGLQRVNAPCGGSEVQDSGL